MILLYPRLPHAIAVRLAGERAIMTVAAAREVAASEHPAATYGPTGGMRVQASNLTTLAESIRTLARSCGYPTPRSSGARDHFDGRLGRLLHEDSKLTPSEACRDGVWSFLACVLVPDIVRWRFPGEQTTHANFLGKDRGIDNALGRCWWAAELLHEKDADDAYELLTQLGVDETVGFSRRSRAVVNRYVAVSLARTVVAIHSQGLPFPRLDLMRDVMKRFLRLAPFVAFESLNDAELEQGFWELVSSSASELARTHGLEYQAPEYQARKRARSHSPGVTRTGHVGTARATAELRRLLAEIEIDSRSPRRFEPIKRWLGLELGLAAEDIAIKRLTDAKNYRNRVGEALRQRPSLAVFLHTGDDTEVLTAIDSRRHLRPSVVALTCGEGDEGWGVGTILAAPETSLAAPLGQRFPDAVVVERDVVERAVPELSVDVEAHIIESIRALALGETGIVDTVEAMVEGLGGFARVKHIVDQKNVRNRISESLGRGASVHILATTAALLDTTHRAAAELQAQSKAPLIIILAQDEHGELSHHPVILSTGRSDHEDEDEDEDEGEGDQQRAAEGPSFLSLDSLEEQALLVADHLLYLGPLTKHEAIRAAAKQLRGAGLLDYQRLRTNGRIYRQIHDAIEMGVRTGHLDRPRRGYIRALLDVADDYGSEEWLEVVRRSLPPGEAISRHDAVRVAASWARDNLGLEYVRIRGKGKIDRGIRNAFRTLLRRDLMEAVSRDEVVLLDPDA